MFDDFERFDRASDDFVNDLNKEEAEAHIRWYSHPEERKGLARIFRPHILSYLKNKSRETGSNHFTHISISGAVQPGRLRE